ncbi:MAG: sorbosone dehydrogenase family protein [Burkholderiales bacterium]|nr:sorbosone dehydrogenase family protein [Burkholderiales bacterium]
MHVTSSVASAGAPAWQKILLASAIALSGSGAWAQDAKPAEVPFWAVGMPKDGPGKQMAPVPAYPVPTAADKLPIDKIKLPPGFKAEVWVSGILDARSMRQGDSGTVFVSSLFVAGKIYAVQEKDGKREIKTIADKLFLPSGIEYHKGTLYVATPKDITRYDNIEANLDNPPKPVMIYDKLPGLVPHGWKFIKVGPDGKLYVPTGAACNICEEKEGFAQIARMNLDGTGMEVVARGVRNTVGFDFHPRTGELWFTNNGRDWLSEDLPNDTLNRVGKPGKDHFGFPFCHQGNFADPEFGWGKRWACASTPARCSRSSTRTRFSWRVTARGTAPRNTRPTSWWPTPTARVASRRWNRS